MSYRRSTGLKTHLRALSSSQKTVPREVEHNKLLAEELDRGACDLFVGDGCTVPNPQCLFNRFDVEAHGPDVCYCRVYPRQVG